MITPADILKLRASAEKADMAVINQIIKQYSDLSRRLQPYINALTNAIQPEMSAAQVQRLSEYKSLIDAIEEELDDFSGALVTAVKSETQRAAEFGIRDGVTLLALALGVSTRQAASVLSAQDDEVLSVLADYLDNSAPLMKRIRGIAQNASGLVADIIKEGVALGRNPLTIAREIVNRGLGVGLTDAMRWTRTVQLYSYRWGTASLYQANSDVVKGWIWWAELDDKVCMSCVSLHGKVFGLEDGIANDHYNGRCAMIPYVPGMTDEYANPNAGREWFDDLSETQQRDLMGRGKYEAYQDGAFEFDQLSKAHNDEVYGTMRLETPLKELIQ